MGRLVLTHSTYVEGLVPWLKRLSFESDIKTITPGVISKVKGRCPELKIRISREIEGGFKLLARKGSSAQEIFVITKLDKDKFEDTLIKSSPKHR